MESSITFLMGFGIDSLSKKHKEHKEHKERMSELCTNQAQCEKRSVAEFAESRVYQSYIGYARKKRRVLAERRRVERMGTEELGVQEAYCVSSPRVSEGGVSYDEYEPYSLVWSKWGRGLPLPPRPPSPAYEPSECDGHSTVCK